MHDDRLPAGSVTDLQRVFEPVKRLRIRRVARCYRARVWQADADSWEGMRGVSLQCP